MKNLNFYCLLMLLLAGCATEKPEKIGENADVIYKEAEILLARHNYEDAAKKFKDVDAYFPYAEKASRAQVMAAYCHFKSGSYADAISAVDIFLRYHPSHNLVPYAMYLKAMSLYVAVSSVGRDSQQAKDAKKCFVELINKFPNCKYVNDSIKRIIILDDIIAAHELMIGRYYQKNRNALAAIGRYDYVLTDFSGTKSAEEALYRMVECCRSIGLSKQAELSAKLFKERFPNSSWKIN
ncbi:MAG: outer membrane protein assembly factor BamD [Alphaproteobacteria bacterium]|nr:outer membrane protein assembly factor BamD [Alphaproteobacteria bacterium]